MMIFIVILFACAFVLPIVGVWLDKRNQEPGAPKPSRRTSEFNVH
jgi:hypothetical protein